MAEASGTREIAKQVTRQRLVSAAAAEFFSKGFDVPSLDSICARAGYTRGAFYVHFKSRDELVCAAMDSVMRALLDAVIADRDGEEDLEATVRRYVAIALRPVAETRAPAGPPFHRMLEACTRSEQVRTAFAGILVEAISRVATAAAAGPRVRDDVSPEEMARILVLLALGSRAAQEIGLPMDLDATQEVLLRLLRGRR